MVSVPVLTAPAPKLPSAKVGAGAPCVALTVSKLPASISVSAATVVVTLGLVATRASRLETSTRPPEALFELESASLVEIASMVTSCAARIVPPASARTVGAVDASTCDEPIDTRPPPALSEPAVARSDAMADTLTSLAMVAALVPMMLPSEAACVVEVILAVGRLDPADKPMPTPTLLTLDSAWLSAIADTATVPSAARTVAPDSIAASVVFARSVVTDSVVS